MTERDASDFGQLWQQLAQHQRELAPMHLRTLFDQDPGRAQRYRLELDGLLLDYSKHRADDQTWTLLQALARVRDVPGWIERLFTGAPVNNTEHRPALHTALRADPAARIEVNGENIVPQIQAVRRRMALLVAAVRGGQWQGFGGEPIRHVVNIGIGGSDLGPAMICQAMTGQGRRCISSRMSMRTSSPRCWRVCHRPGRCSSSTPRASRRWRRMPTPWQRATG